MRKFVFGLLFFGQMFMYGLSILGAAKFFSEQNHQPLLALVAWAGNFATTMITLIIIAENWVLQKGSSKEGGAQ